MPKTRIPNTAKGPFNPARQIRLDFEFAKRCLISDGTVMPVFVVHTKGMVIPIGFNGTYDDEGRRNHRRYARLLSIAHNAFAIAYIGEAWVAISLPDEPVPEFPRVRPRDREDRREVILSQLMWRDKETGERWSNLAQAEIVRNEKGDPTRVKDEEFTDPTNMIMGNFSEILPEDEPTPAEQEQAKIMLDWIEKSGGIARMPTKFS